MTQATRRSGFCAVIAAAAVAAVTAVQSAPQSPSAASMRADQVIAGWKAVPQEAAKQMIAKYGQPQEVTANRLIWHNNGPWKYSELANEEIPHDFPMPHKDALYQAVNFRIDPQKADELLAYDGSIVLDRTKGEIAARCDKEEANFLAINLANDIATGRRSVEDARKFYADSIMMMMKQNKKNEYLQGFRFQVLSGDQGDRDKPFGMIGTTGRGK